MSCGSCRVPPPTQVCNACLRNNKKCDYNCRQAVVYDTTRTVKQRAEWLKKNYTDGQSKELKDYALKIPKAVQKAFDALFQAPAETQA